jgi:hypothetical protein
MIMANDVPAASGALVPVIRFASDIPFNLDGLNSARQLFRSG